MSGANPAHPDCSACYASGVRCPAHLDNSVPENRTLFIAAPPLLSEEDVLADVALASNLGIQITSGAARTIASWFSSPRNVNLTRLAGGTVEFSIAGLRNEMECDPDLVRDYPGLLLAMLTWLDHNEEQVYGS